MEHDPITFILAGGLGTRLRSIIGDLPKPMAPIAGRPFLEYQVGVLRAQGIADIVLCVGYRHDLIQQHFGDGAAFGVRIAYSVETEPLGTGGALRQSLAAVRPERAFFVVNGDTYFDGRLASLLAAHQAGGAPATLALVHKPDAGRYGAVTLDPAGAIVRFAEKSSAAPGLINAGVYALSPAVLDVLPARTPLSLETDVFPALVQAGQLHGCLLDGQDMDIGTPEGYALFQRYVAEQQAAP